MEGITVCSGRLQTRRTLVAQPIKQLLYAALFLLVVGRL